MGSVVANRPKTLPMPADQAPVFSIIMATYNAAACLERAIDSIAAQTCPGVELIVVDGGSADGTQDILRRREHQIAAWISEPDNGIYDAWNKGVARARGEWLYFIGADDGFSHPDALVRAAERLSRLAPSTMVAYGQVELVDDHGRVVEVQGASWDRSRPDFVATGMNIPHQGVFHRRALFAQGAFDASFRIAGDYELLLRSLRRAEPVFLDALVVARWQQGGISTDPRRAVQVMREFRRAQRKNGWPVPRVDLPLARAALKSWLARYLGQAGIRRLIDLYRRLGGRPSRYAGP